MMERKWRRRLPWDHLRIVVTPPERSVSRRRWLTITFNILAISAAVVALTWPARHVYMRGHNDFLSFYAGGKLAFTDALYDPPTVAAVQEAYSGTAGPALRFIRLPFYAVPLSALAVLSYLPAYALWQTVNILCSASAVFLWPYDRYRFAQVASLWVPLYWSFLNGQDIGMLLLFIVLTIRWMSWSSLLACLIKFHFFWLSPMAIPLRTFAKAVIPTLILFVVPMIWHPTWPLKYYEAVIHGRPIISHVPVSIFPYFGWFGPVVAALVTLRIAHKHSMEVAFSSAVALAVAVSPHAYFQDYSLAIPLLALVWERASIRTQALTKDKLVCQV